MCLVQAFDIMKLQESLAKVETHLSALDQQSVDQLSFEWEGINFKAEVQKLATGVTHIVLDAKLGRLYFTIEDAANRTMAIERLYANNRSTDGAYSLKKNGEVFFKSLTKTEKILSGQGLYSAVTIILLESSAHLRTLRAHLKK